MSVHGVGIRTIFWAILVLFLIFSTAEAAPVVEPSTVSIPSGNYVSVQLQGKAGGILEIVVRVEDIPDVDPQFVDVYLLNSENYSKYQAGVDFQYIESGSRLMVNNARYRFTTTTTAEYWLVIDNVGTLKPEGNAVSIYDLDVYVEVNDVTGSVPMGFPELALSFAVAFLAWNFIKRKRVA